MTDFNHQKINKKWSVRDFSVKFVKLTLRFNLSLNEVSSIKKNLEKFVETVFH